MRDLLRGLRLAVFDFDGVILESADIKTDAFLELFADHPQHRRAILDYHLAHQGISRYRKFEWICRELLGRTISDAESKALGERFSKLVLDKVLAAPFVPGAPEVLRALQGRMPLAVASGTPEGELRHIVEARGLASLFADVCGTPRGKPEILRDLIARHGATAADTLMVGDANTDYDAALEVGTRFYARTVPHTVETWAARGVAMGSDLHPLLAGIPS